jgi:hypothetical protein
VQESIRKLLEVEPEGVIRSSAIIRTNICPSVSVSGDRERALVDLLRSPRFIDAKSIVIYCMLQKQVTSLSLTCVSPLWCADESGGATDRGRCGIPHRRRL